MIENPLLSDELSDLSAIELMERLLLIVIRFLFLAGFIAFFLMLLIGGVQWITSGGDKVAVQNAKGRIVHALIGISLLLSVFAIISLVEMVFHVSILEIDVGIFNLTEPCGPSGAACNVPSDCCSSFCQAGSCI